MFVSSRAILSLGGRVKARGSRDGEGVLEIKDPPPARQVGDDAAEDGPQDERHGERAPDHGADEARLVGGAVFGERYLREAVEA